MSELVQVAKNTYYIKFFTHVGVYEYEPGWVYLIDSAWKEKDAVRIREIMDEKGWKIKAIINTHSHVDHVGGNLYLQKHYGCQIFTKGLEVVFTNSAMLEPSLFFGAYPPENMRQSFCVERGNKVLDVSHPDFPKELEIFELPGHYFEMIGVRTPDGVVFAGDCACSAQTLEKHQIGYLYNVQAFLESLDKLAAMKAELFVPAHTEPVSDMKELRKINRVKIFETADKIVELCSAQPMCFEELLKHLFDIYHLKMNDEQYYMVGNAVKAYLSWLKDNGRLVTVIEDNRMLWKGMEA